MTEPTRLPKMALIYHEADRIDAEGLASWLAHSFDLVGLVVLQETSQRLVKKARAQIARFGLLHFLDVLALRLYYRVRLARADAAWVAHEVARLRATYPARLDSVPRLAAADPNTAEVRSFLRGLDPDLVIARCKFILRPEIFEIPKAGTFVLHPGICPEYRNSHGCFWALAGRDLDRVGMTLLQADKGVDTGPIYLQATYAFNEIDESHVVIQHRVVLENLDAIRRTLIAVWKGDARPVSTDGRRSAVWGQPGLSAYLRWKSAARKRR
jgi:folate-dependent phosphoribosylglycinamide formyltransferase PurN